MSFKFSNLNDMKEFAKYLSNELDKLGYKDEAKRINEFSYNSYTTSSEYLGEFRFLLEELKKYDILKNANMLLEADRAIKAINKAFES